MKKIASILLAMVFLCLIFAPATALAAADFRYFNSYTVSIDVLENNVLSITETIVCDFDKSYEYSRPGRGIVRFIPKSLQFNEKSGTKRYRIGISELNTYGMTYFTEEETDYLSVYLGDRNQYVTGGIVEYKISYLYDIGELGFEDFELFYFNIVGNEWDAKMERVDFQVNFPKPVDFTNEPPQAYRGMRGSTSQKEVDISFSGNTISGSTQNLSPYEGVTVLQILPKGYFVGARNDVGGELPIVFGAAAILLAALLCFWFFGRDNKLIPVVSFYPPQGLDSASVGYVADEAADSKDLTSLLIYWANMGIMSINQPSKKDFVFEKTGELSPDAPAYQRTMWEGLFDSRDRVELNDLKNTFYTTVNAAKNALTSYFSVEERRLYYKQSTFLKGLFTFLTAGATFGFGYYCGYMVEGSSDAVFSAILPTVAVVAVMGFFNRMVSQWNTMSIVKKFFRAFWFVIVMVVVFGLFYIFVADDPITPLYAILIILCIMFTGILAVFMKKRTKQGYNWNCEILGLRNFIKMAELDRIKLLCQENPNYFYSVLPYAYVLGLTDVWAKNFEGIAIEPPTWYYGSGDVFSLMLFTSVINRSLHSFTAAAVSAPSSGGSGGFSVGGGGFSGGGFGGGGGGGW